MSRLRLIVVCLLALVLVAAQAVTAVQASAMTMETAAAAEAPGAMAEADMSGDCDGCGTAEADPGLCPANCCASCSTTAAVMPGGSSDARLAVSARSAAPFRLSLGLTPSPHPTPPRSLVLG